MADKPATGKVSPQGGASNESESGNGRKPGDRKKGRGLRFQRLFTTPGSDPLNEVKWVYREAEIRNDRGEVIFEQKNIEVPDVEGGWSDLAVNVVASKYFRGKVGSPERESSIRGLISRVADTIADWGRKQAYFATEEDAQAFRDELVHLFIHQKAAFNSPVWFNCGVEEKPQCSACFINSVQDTMDSILRLARTEGMLFKYGSGTGTNFSSLRSSAEHLTGGGTASGPVSFMRGFDAFAGVIKSGGRTRRAAKMVILDISHPDIVGFIQSKANEEKKAWALIDSGYEGGFNVPGGAYDSIMFQNANHSVRVTDDFMEAQDRDDYWETHEVLTGNPAGRYKARELFAMIAEAAHICGDPGIQFDSTINRWHTCKNSGRIRASNPCSEYMFLDDSACNLASLNLMRFLDADGDFNIEVLRHAVAVMVTAMEIIVDNASYPTEAIARNSSLYRPLGLGYANLGALLMARGIPYDSDEGRALAAVVTALMTGEAYAQSGRMAAELGPFEKFESNREAMLGVISMHRAALADITPSHVPSELLTAATDAWNTALELGNRHGFRNAQTSVLAPTGTIGFMMDCDTTGIEPDIALVKHKKLVGGGSLKYVNRTAPSALRRLGYSEEEIAEIQSYIDEHATIEGAPYLQDEHLPVFDCAFRPVSGVRSIHYMGHVRMMGAVQPFISGAISKTVNLPNDITPEEIMEVYRQSWKLGLKAIAVYRDGCKRSQPLTTGKEGERRAEGGAPAPKFAPIRRRLPDERRAITHKFDIAGHEGYITIGMFDDGTPGEIFLVMAKEGSVVSGLMDSFATAISLALQYGVPLEALINKFSHAKFDPSGFTRNRQIPHAKSVVDYIFRWLATKFLPADRQRALGIHVAEESAPVEQEMEDMEEVTPAPTETYSFHVEDDAPPCPDCGAIMVRNGSCYRCLTCGATSGCS
jgi:ribonucleoside-diphosphate reductase alpha chain